MAIDGVNSSLYFTASQFAAASQAKANKNDKTEKTKKTSFSSIFDKTNQEYSMIQEGFPAEIAGMDTEEAAIFLKDEADIAADNLREKQTPEAFMEYKKKVTQFLRYVQKNNYEVIKHERKGITKRNKPIQPKYHVEIINQKLDEMATWMLSTHKDTLKLLAKINELQGLLVDLMT